MTSPFQAQIKLLDTPPVALGKTPYGPQMKANIDRGNRLRGGTPQLSTAGVGRGGINYPGGSAFPK
jgi:hypothetical protein